MKFVRNDSHLACTRVKEGSFYLQNDRNALHFSHKMTDIPKKTIFLWLLGCICISFIFEALTLFGAPLSSVLDPTAWSKRRIFIFFIISMAVSMWLYVIYKQGAFKHFFGFWSTNTRQKLKLSVRTICGSIIIILLLKLFSIYVVKWDDWRLSFVLEICGVVFYLFLKFRKVIFRQIEWGFLILFLSFGTLMCFCEAPTTFVSWDDQIHYSNSLALSYILYPEYTSADIALSESSGPLFQAATTEPNGSNYYVVASLSKDSVEFYRNYIDNLGRSGAFKASSATATTLGNSYVSISFLGHIPNAIGLWFGRLLHLSNSGIVIFGKLANLVFAAAVYFFAIRRLKSGKLIVAVLALIPVSVFLAASYSYDTWLNVLTTYAICSYVSELQSPEHKMNWYTTAKILVPFLLGATVKAVYFPLLICVLFLNKSKFSNEKVRKRYLTAVSLVALFLCLTIVLPYIPIGGHITASTGDPRGGAGINAFQQASRILENPYWFFIVLIRFTYKFLNPYVFMQTGIVLMGYINQPPITELIAGVAVQYLILMAVVAVLDRQECDFEIARCHVAIPSILAIALSYIAVVCALYLTFTPVGYYTVNGVQERYLFPCLVPFLLITCYSRMSNKSIQIKEMNYFFIAVELCIWIQMFLIVYISRF